MCSRIKLVFRIWLELDVFLRFIWSSSSLLSSQFPKKPLEVITKKSLATSSILSSLLATRSCGINTIPREPSRIESKTYDTLMFNHLFYFYEKRINFFPRLRNLGLPHWSKENLEPWALRAPSWIWHLLSAMRNLNIYRSFSLVGAICLVWMIWRRQLEFLITWVLLTQTRTITVTFSTSSTSTW